MTVGGEKNRPGSRHGGRKRALACPKCRRGPSLPACRKKGRKGGGRRGGSPYPLGKGGRARTGLHLRDRKRIQGVISSQKREKRKKVSAGLLQTRKEHYATTRMLLRASRQKGTRLSLRGERKKEKKGRVALRLTTSLGKS